MKNTKYFIYLFITILLVCACSDDSININGGTYVGDLADGKPSGYGTWTHKDTSYCGFWKNGVRHGQGLYKYGKYTYRGNFNCGLYDGAGVLAADDSILYSGNWTRGKRQGIGEVRDSCGRKIIAIWNCDTITYGTRYDICGTYTGYFGRNRLPLGKGRYVYDNSLFYEGEWKNDLAHGFGMQFSPDGLLKIGNWIAGEYKGEIVYHNTDRIYGIDISRYQHEIGNEIYPIDWSNLRITSLGTKTRKQIVGAVNYPVSFVYIKCTEGTGVVNKYYTGDYYAARSHNINAGAYHFFRLDSDPYEQAVHFLSRLKLNNGDLPPVLDVEPSEDQIDEAGGNYEMFRRIRIWMETVESKVGIRPLLYVNQTFVRRHLMLAPDIWQKYDIWIARYGEFKPNIHMIHWQLSPDGRVNGIVGDVDINVFNGYGSSFKRYIRNKTYRKRARKQAVNKDLSPDSTNLM